MTGSPKQTPRLRSLAAGLLTLFALPIISAALRPIDLALLLDRNAAAMGGRALLDTLHSVVILRTATSLFSLKLPHFVLVEGYDSTGGVHYAEGYDGHAAWEQSDTDATRRVVTGRAEVALRRVVEWPNNLLALYRVGEYGGRLALEGRDANGADSAWRIRLTLPDGFERWYYVNAVTYRIDRARDTRELHANDGRTRTIETVFTDYREVDGYWFPFTVFERDATTGERLFGRTVLGIWPNIDLPDSLFSSAGRSDHGRLALFRGRLTQ